jgi:hypothetical protein
MAILLLFCVRGVLLWLVVPLAFCLWILLLLPRAVFGRTYVSPGKVIAFADLNLSAAIGLLLLRPLGKDVPFTSWSELETIEHRVRIVDPW